MRTTGDPNYRYTAVGGNSPKPVDELKDVMCWPEGDPVRVKILDKAIKDYDNIIAKSAD
jgi:hypothetical protein